MAAILNLQLQYGYSNGSDILPSINVRVDAAPASGARIDVNIASSTSDATLDTTLVPSIGYIVIINLDATNDILVGPDGTSYPNRIKPGGFLGAFWNAAAIHFKSSAATPRIRALVWSA